MRRSLMVMLSVVAFAACPAVELRETCGDGIDNDGNGFADCDDIDCKGQPACIPPDYGRCAKCSHACTSQAECVTSYFDERPIPQCVDGRCWAVATFIQPRVELETTGGWSIVTPAPQSASTRFIKKTAIDGSAVSCATVAATAADRNTSNAIEASGKYSILGIDVTRVTPPLGQGVTLAFVNTQTADDYLIWAELWGGLPSSSTKMPTGRRFGYGCFESKPLVAPMTAVDNCPSTTSDAGVCRVFHLVMPAPEM